MLQHLILCQNLVIYIFVRYVYIYISITIRCDVLMVGYVPIILTLSDIAGHAMCTGMCTLTARCRSAKRTVVRLQGVYEEKHDVMVFSLSKYAYMA